MSITLMAAAWKIDGGPTDKLVLLALADRANDEGRDCWPSIKTLGEKTGLSERGLQVSIARLVEQGHLSREVVTGRGVNYHVHPRTSCTPALDAPPHETSKTPARRAPNTSRIHQGVRVQRAKPLDAFWKLYPNRKGKLAAERALDKAIKRDGLDRVMDGTRRYAEHIAKHPPDDSQYLPHPATWLNRGSYDDEIEEPQNGNTNGHRPMGGSGRSEHPRVQPALSPSAAAAIRLRERFGTAAGLHQPGDC